MIFSRCLVWFLAMVLLAGAAGLGAQTKRAVGIAMPTQANQRWIQDGDHMRQILRKRGYSVILQYAEGNIDVQKAQIENMIDSGVSCLVISAIDGGSLTEVLARAEKAKIPVIAYDRLLMNTSAVTYYASFDNHKVGVQQAMTLVRGLRLDRGAKGPFNIEIFAGSPDDNNSIYFFNGAMEVLQPFLDRKILSIRSGQTGFPRVAVLHWDGGSAQKRMYKLITTKYGNARIDAILSPYDGISIGVIAALKSLGYGRDGQTMPLVSGQDAELPSVKAMMAGEQYSTIFKDTRILAKRAADMVDAAIKGSRTDINDTTSYFNGIKTVPSWLCEPVPVYRENIKSVLVDSGYYTAAQAGIRL